MKKLATAIMLLFIVTVAVSAFAGDQNVRFNSPTIVNGTKLEPGDYVVKYDIKGNMADVKVLKNNKAVVTTTGKVVESKDNVKVGGVVRSINADGTSSLKAIQVPNKNQIIQLEGDTAVGK